MYAEIETAPNKTEHVALKLLSEDPQHYDDAPREGIRRVIQKFNPKSNIAKATDIDTKQIEWIRMGTTVATNALLERKGAPCVLITTKGFRDLLRIGNQSRPNIFDLVIRKPELLYAQIVEVDERVKVVKEKKQDDENIVTCANGSQFEVLRRPNMKLLEQQLKEIRTKHNITSAAVVLIHSYAFDQHERMIGELCERLGFTNVSLSNKIMPMIRAVPRGHTTCVDAYLTPVLRTYVNSFRAGFRDGLRDVRVQFMQSDGGLTNADTFMGCRAILSGPAGGVVGYASTGYEEKRRQPVIGFDMGGTSTDVSRYGGVYEHVYETECAGVTIQAPQLDINTVAAGGGSRLFFKMGRFVVGPESAGAHPGPICYRKNGYLAVTDANLFLGRILPEFFPNIFGPNEDEPLDVNATRKAFEEMTKRVNATLPTSRHMTPEQVALGFVSVADESMCRPIRSMTVSKGYDTRDHALCVFGGAGAQHACSIARKLNMKRILINRHAGILSAYGLGLADVVQEEQEACGKQLNPENMKYFEQRLQELEKQAVKALIDEGFSKDKIETIKYLNLRYERTDYAIMTDLKLTKSYREEFEVRYKREYGFTIPDRKLVVDDIRVRGIGHTPNISKHQVGAKDEEPKPIKATKTYFEQGGWHETPVYRLDDCGAGSKIAGPSIIIHDTTTMVIIPGASATITADGNVEIELRDVTQGTISTEADSVHLSIFNHRFMSIAEQMGTTLQRTSISTNIKERLDFSCAIFGPQGTLIANAPHLPVHLGSMSEAVTFQIKHLGDKWKEGEVLMANHPIAGGTHLPDITVITPVYGDVDGKRKPVFYVASRGHHADIGGISPGSMPPFSRTIHEEGAAIVSFKLVENDRFQLEGLKEILKESRCISDNVADLKAQVASNNQGVALIQELIREYTLDVVQAYMQHVQDNAELAVREMLMRVVQERKTRVLKAVDFMDDGSKIQLCISIDEKSRSATFDFTGTSSQVMGNTNAPKAVAVSAILYCLRCLVTESIPLNHGCMVPITCKIPPRSLLDPSFECAVVGGNVLTSQRVTDVILKAFEAVSASQGCMNNFIFGDSTFGYYETIAGGSGAGDTWDGQSGVHTHMTNTRITDVEILETRYPVLLRQFSIRRGSGGNGRHRGGDGVTREFEFLRPLEVGILSERRVFGTLQALTHTQPRTDCVEARKASVAAIFWYATMYHSILVPKTRSRSTMEMWSSSTPQELEDLEKRRKASTNGSADKGLFDKG